MKTQVREADMRSLERRSMYSIFAPLDPNERLPRELLIEQRRFRTVGRREVAGLLWLPALLLTITAVGWIGVPAAIGMGAIMILSSWLYVQSGKQKTR
jgi:hypothetical protein